MKFNNENKYKLAAVYASSFLLGSQLNRLIIKKDAKAIVPVAVALYLTVGLAAQAYNGLKAQELAELIK